MHEASQKLPMLSWWQFEEDESSAKICEGKYQYIENRKRNVWNCHGIALKDKMLGKGLEDSHIIWMR